MSSNNYIQELKKIVNDTVSEIEQMPVHKLTEHFTTGIIKDTILPALVPLQEALKDFEGDESSKIEEKAHNIHSIKKLRNAVSDTIKEIESIPKFKTEIEGKSWSSEQLKDTIVPLLAQSQKRINDIENVANQIDSVRNEILEPVKKLIEDKDRYSKIFSWVGIIIGFIGLSPLIYNYYISTKLNEKPPFIAEKGNGGFSNEDIDRLGEFADYKEIDSLKSLFAVGLLGEGFSLDAASSIIRNKLKNPDKEEIKLLVGILFYLKGDFDYSNEKLKGVSSEYLINDKNLILRLINLRQSNIDKSNDLNVNFSELWLPIAAVDAREMLKEENEIKKRRIKICIYDGSAGKGKLTTSEGKRLKSILEKKEWANISISSFDYSAFNLNVEKGARSQLWIKDRDDELLKDFEKDLMSYNSRFMNANSPNPDYPSTIERIKSNCNSPDVIILLGI